jgi:hypothetical protein
VIEIETTEVLNWRTVFISQRESSVSVNNASILMSTELTRASASGATDSKSSETFRIWIRYTA